MRTALPYINFILIVAIFAYLYLQRSSTQTVYVLNNELFAKFKGTQELQLKLKTMKEKNRTSIDSLIDLGQRNLNNSEILNVIARQQESIQLTEQQISDQYTVDIWKRINTYMKEFGETNGYRFVFGATGDGTMMYAEEGSNVTEAAIMFINKKYQESE